MKIIKIHSSTYLFLLLAFICGLFKKVIIILLIVLIHELGHLLIARIYRFKILSVNIYPFGGISIIDKDINTKIIKEIILASGGVLMQILLMLVLPFIPLRITTYNLILKYNKIILLFNLLPIIPLDGSIIINSILNKYLSFYKSYCYKLAISITSLVIFIYFNINYALSNFLIIVFLMYKTYVAYKDFNYIYNKFLLERLLHNYEYKKIMNNTKNINQLKLETFHYFNDNNLIKNEKLKLQELFDKNPYL